MENLTGASGGRYRRGRHPPGDGHTLLFVTNDFAVAPTVSSKVNYDAIKSFAPVTTRSRSPQWWWCTPRFRQNMQELITLDGQSGRTTYASLGIGFREYRASGCLPGLGLDVVGCHSWRGADHHIDAGGAPIAMLGLPPAVPHKGRHAARARRHQPALAGVSRRSDHGGISACATGVRADIGVVAPAATPKPIVDLESQIARTSRCPT